MRQARRLATRRSGSWSPSEPKKPLVTGTDFGHNDASTELFAFRDRPTIGGINQDTIHGIMGTNAQTLYGLSEAGPARALGMAEARAR